MTPPVATSRMRAFVSTSARLSLFALVAACTTQAVYTPGELSQQQRTRCQELAQAYVDQAPDYRERRDELAEDPTAIRWFVRWLEAALVQVREASAERIPDEKALFTGAGILKDGSRFGMTRPQTMPGRRELEEIVAIGVPAIEVVMQDLVLSEQGFLRALGLEILLEIGEPAVPRLVELARDGDVRAQRNAARALGAIGAEGEGLAALERLSHSSEWLVRSDVAQALAADGPEARDLLLRMLADEQDTFVRGQILKSLGTYRDREVGEVLVEHLVAAHEELDGKSARAAQSALETLAKKPGVRSAAAWLTYVQQLPSASEAAAQRAADNASTSPQQADR